MAWDDIGPDSDVTWDDINIPASFVTDQNEDILESQGGSPVMTQSMGSVTNWSDIS